jgi:hypothetical protein
MYISELDPADPRASAIIKSEVILKRAQDTLADLKRRMDELEAAKPAPAYTIEKGHS